MHAPAVNGFWELRWDAWRAVRHDAGARQILGWDLARVVVWAAFFIGGYVLDLQAAGHDGASNLWRLMIGITTFGTFLASFVLTVMNSTGRRHLTLAHDANNARQMEERLRWLLSDQLIMVVSALAAAVTGLAWLALSWLVVGAVQAILTALAMAFGGLAAVNAFRLPFQLWELQSSRLAEEKRHAIRRLNKEVEDLFKE